MNTTTSYEKEKNVKRIITIVATALIICLVVVGLLFTRYWSSGMKPVSNNNKRVTIQVPMGSSTKTIGDILENKGLIKSGFVFSYYAKTHKKTDFQAGYYTLSPNMGVKKIVSTMQQGASDDPRGMPIAKITINEGLTVSQIGDLIAKNTPYTKKEFLSLMKDKAFYNKMAKKYPKLFASEKESLPEIRYYFEGYLFPATYNLYPKESLKEFVSEIIKNTDLNMQEFYKPIEQQNLTVHEVLTLASLVEKEGQTETDRRKIAGVFFNRLKINMPLQSDVTVIYAMNKHKVFLSTEDTQYQSPYNLYINAGYGPGPYNNPGKQSIDAVVYPDQNDYLYFLADVKTGKVYYAETYDKHLELSDKYIGQ